MRVIRFTSMLSIIALLVFTDSAPAQQGMPGELSWDLQKLRGRNNCTRDMSCDMTFNAENSWNAGELAESTSLKNCAQVEVQTIDGGRYAVRSHLPTLGANTLMELKAALDLRMQSDDTFPLETWSGKKLLLLPRSILLMNVTRCQ